MHVQQQQAGARADHKLLLYCARANQERWLRRQCLISWMLIDLILSAILAFSQTLIMKGACIYPTTVRYYCLRACIPIYHPFLVITYKGALTLRAHTEPLYHKLQTRVS